MFSFFSVYAYQKIQEENLILTNINKINIFENDIKDIEQKISTIQDRLSGYKFLKKEFFGTGHEAEELYNLLSQLALDQKLLIENISKGKIEKYFKNDIFPITENEGSNDSNEIDKQVIISKIMVDYRIVGKYEDYMEFRKCLSEENNIISIDYEEINVADSLNPGKISVKLKISTYRMGEFDYAKI